MSDIRIKAILLGGGERRVELLEHAENHISAGLNMTLIGIWDENFRESDIKFAHEYGIPVYPNLDEILTLNGLNLIIDLSRSPSIRKRIQEKIIEGVSVVDFNTFFSIMNHSSGSEPARNDLNDNDETQVILDSLPYRIIVINMNKTIETVNQTFLREYNLSFEDAVGKPCHDVLSRLNRPCQVEGQTCYVEEHINEIRDKGLFSTYHEYVAPSGETRYDVITLAPIFDRSGNIIRILEASRDVTDRIILEKDAEKSNTFLQNMIQSTVDGIVVVDIKGNVLLFNEGMERLTGYSSKEIMHKGHLSSFYDINTAKENMKKMRSSSFGPVGKLNPTSMNITTKTGEEIPVTLSASIITIDGKETGSVGVFTDMREILQMRKELEEAHLQLIQSEKIASVGRMAAGVAHEINNPLSGILIFAELLKDNLKHDTQNSKDIQEIIDQTLRCKKIVAELLEFSRQSVGNVSAFSLESLIDKALNILINQAIFQNIEVIREIDPQLPDMAGDLGQLQQVFINLFTNAADAMEGKGVLRIKASYNNENNLFYITVADTGHGIPEGLREKIFDIFFSTKPVGKGTGLGLSICQNIIKLHGGSITVECPAEGGTKFIIQLPHGFIGHPVEEPVFLGLDEQ